MKFKVTWTSGKVEVIESEAETADQLAMQMWGAPSAEFVENEYKVTIIATDEPLTPTAADAPAVDPVLAKRIAVSDAKNIRARGA